MLPIAKLPDPHSRSNNDRKTTAMSDKETNIEHTEGGRFAGSSLGRPQTRGQKIKSHFKKWWWLHLLVFVSIVVLVVCLM